MSRNERHRLNATRSFLRNGNILWFGSSTIFAERRTRLLTLAVFIPYQRSERPLNLLIDSTGIKRRAPDLGGGLSWTKT